MSRNVKDILDAILDFIFFSVYRLVAYKLRAFPLLFFCNRFIPYHDNENTNFMVFPYIYLLLISEKYYILYGIAQNREFNIPVA